MSTVQGHVAIHRGGSFRGDTSLLGEMHALLVPSYCDPRSLLLREVEHCDTLYIARDADQCLSAFFLVAWESLVVGGRPLPAVYMGLSAAREDTKNTGQIRELYAQFLGEAAEWQEATKQRLVLWFTTATPSAYLAAAALFGGLQPRTDGGYSVDSVLVAASIRQRYYTSSSRPAHPFVLPNVAGDTRYSESERDRIARVCERKRFTLLADLGVNESDGARVWGRYKRGFSRGS